MVKITVKELESLNYGDDGRRIRDDGGLVGKVRVKADGVSIHWSWRYRFSGKMREIAAGTWPRDSLADIRRKRDCLAHTLAQGRDPGDDRKVQRLQARSEQLETVLVAKSKLAEVEALKTRLTVQGLFERWEISDLSRRKDKGAEVRRGFEKDVLPKLGEFAAEDVKRKHVAEVLLAVVARGSRIVARRLLGDIRQMYGFGIASGLLDDDPTSHMKRDHYGRKTERERVLSEAEIRALPAALKAGRMSDESVLSVWIILGTCCRVGELAMAQWCDVDFEARTWRIPATTAKNGKEHTIQLSDFVLGKFEALHAITGKSGDIPGIWVLPAKRNKGHLNVKTITKQITDRQRGERGAMSHRSAAPSALILPGGRWTPHDLRRTGATMMGALGVWPNVVERCLNHVETDEMKRTYQRHGYRDEMGKAWVVLGDRLAALMVPNVVMLRTVAA